METVTIYHNPRCAKSRAALEILRQRRVPLEVVEYLKTPLSLSELRALRTKLALPPSAWVRKGEKEYKAAGLSAQSTEEDILKAMSDHPILMERPIVVRGQRAVVGRPPERVVELLD